MSGDRAAWRLRSRCRAAAQPPQTAMHMHMKHIFTIGAIAGATLLSGCKKEIEKHEEHNTDTAAFHHPPNDIGAPVRNPAPEPRTDTQPATGNQQTMGTGHK